MFSDRLLSFQLHFLFRLESSPANLREYSTGTSQPLELYLHIDAYFMGYLMVLFQILNLFSKETGEEVVPLL
jgi:hypothetical protein